MNSKIQKAEDGKNADSAKKCVQTGKKQAAQVAVLICMMYSDKRERN